MLATVVLLLETMMQLHLLLGENSHRINLSQGVSSDLDFE